MSASRRTKVFASVLLVGSALGWFACARGTRAAEAVDGELADAHQGAPATAPARATQVYENRDAHFTVAYPGDWTARSNPRNVLTVGPPSADPRNTPELGIAVPKLPFHIPGMIPLGEVEKGYVADIRKRHTDVHVDRTTEVSFDNANARRFVISARHNETGPRVYDVLVVYRPTTDKLYVITSEAPPADAATAHAVLDGVRSSWRWTK